MIHQSHSEKDTQKIAQKLAGEFSQKGGVIALIGELGAGKTTFTQAFAKALGVKERVISPTFILIRQHSILHNLTLFHIDLYRVETNQDTEKLGLSEIINHPNHLVLIEWADKLKNIPYGATIVTIRKLSENIRQISVEKSSSIN